MLNVSSMPWRSLLAFDWALSVVGYMGEVHIIGRPFSLVPCAYAPQASGTSWSAGTGGPLGVEGGGCYM
jgi:hypothetical protein